MPDKEVKIVNIKELFEPAFLGIDRAIIFSAIVCNPKNKILAEEFIISNKYFNVHPQKGTEKEKSLVEFKEFVINNCVREVYVALEKTRRDIICILRKHKENGVSYKESNLLKKLGISDDMIGLFNSLKVPRDAMSHNGYLNGYKNDKQDIKLKIIHGETLHINDIETEEEKILTHLGGTIDFSKLMPFFKSGTNTVSFGLEIKNKQIPTGSMIGFDGTDIASLCVEVLNFIYALREKTIYKLLSLNIALIIDGFKIGNKKEFDALLNKKEKNQD